MATASLSSRTRAAVTNVYSLLVYFDKRDREPRDVREAMLFRQDNVSGTMETFRVECGEPIEWIKRHADELATHATGQSNYKGLWVEPALRQEEPA
jgi:hypothetical protein